ncbi:hypothetical protein ACIRQY_22070 [Streptomyces sp. NPDC101490]|uniref:hypothetical protein n=1 Tax=Streptomyces sp. NPDC101490 TaxID=3366143 RepID=UPI00381684A4
MTSEGEAALAGASSASWVRRVRAGRDLAPLAGIPRVAEALVGLLLDDSDTAVTRATAEALARTGTVAAVRLVARAVSLADDQQSDWLWTGLHDVLAEPPGVPVPDLAAICGELARDPEETVRRGAADILAWADGGGP